MPSNENQPIGTDMLVFEISQLLEQLEQLILEVEKDHLLQRFVGESFRIMHTIKGSCAMMEWTTIADLAHAVEDIFAFLRDNKVQDIEWKTLTDILLSTIDFIRTEVGKNVTGCNQDGDCSELHKTVKACLFQLKEQSLANGGNDVVKQSGIPLKYRVVIFFEENCGMENLRAFSLVQDLNDIAQDITYMPEDILDNDDSIEIICSQGFRIEFTSDKSLADLECFFKNSMFVNNVSLELVVSNTNAVSCGSAELEKQDIAVEASSDNSRSNTITAGTVQQQFINVNIKKMDALLDLVGELVTAENMVVQNPDLQGLTIENFYKASRQLRKITNAIQDLVMSIRMVPVATIFHKMYRIVRDMSNKLDKKIVLEISGDDTEIDKNIIDHLSDPIMHLIRNAIDHGIENAEERNEKGKPETGIITLEAKQVGREVWVSIKDDGRGLDKEKIINQAVEMGIVTKPVNELTDKDIYAFILVPGFSTKEKVTEFSGRGVGMDAVVKTIEEIGGTISVESSLGQGTVIILKIPLTLAIMDGMLMKAGNNIYTLPSVWVKETFCVTPEEIIHDTDNREMLIIRDRCYQLIRLSEIYHLKNCKENFDNGIVIMLADDNRQVCLFADALLGEQQVVVKTLPTYLRKVKGIAGCTLLGDGSISLILDIASLLEG